MKAFRASAEKERTEAALKQKEWIIEASHLQFSYKGDDGSQIPVIRDLSLQIEKGSFVAILGHNGSGKSTLAKLINLILIPQAGRLTINGTETTRTDITEEEILRLRQTVGMVFQNPDNQLVATIVEEDVAFGPENLGVPPEEIRRRVDEALETVHMLAYRRHAPHQLSGGQKQRIAIAGMIAMLPDCMIFDESTAMLDPRGREEVMDTIEKLNREKGITVLHITHEMKEAIRADRIIVMNDGQILMDDTPRNVFSRVEELQRVGLDVPQAAELALLLRRGGVPLPEDLLYTEETAKAIAAVLKAGKGEMRHDGN